MAIENKEINVEGMHCPSCKLAVEMSLKDLEGVEDAVADFETGKGTRRNTGRIRGDRR